MFNLYFQKLYIFVIIEVRDQCGVCGGDGKSCLDCSGAVDGGDLLMTMTMMMMTVTIRGRTISAKIEMFFFFTIRNIFSKHSTLQICNAEDFHETCLIEHVENADNTGVIEIIPQRSGYKCKNM